MIPRTAPAPAKGPRPKPSLFQNCLLISLAAHALLFISLSWRPSSPGGSPVEIDLTLPYGGGPAKLAAPKKRVKPAAPPGPAQASAPIATAVPTPVPAVPVQPPVQLPMAGKEAVPLPSPAGSSEGTQVAPIPGGHPDGVANPSGGGTAEGTGLSPKLGGSGEGAADGVPGGTGLGGGRVDVWPKLLNRDELMAALRRLYPESERRAGREGDVAVAIHIGADGLVSSADVLRSAGPAFDAAAQKAAAIMRFSPAAVAGRPVAVKIKQTIYFRLTE